VAFDVVLVAFEGFLRESLCFVDEFRAAVGGREIVVAEFDARFLVLRSASIISGKRWRPS
jgi:hypothetical protein